MSTDQIFQDTQYIRAGIDELLRRVGGVPAQGQQVVYYPSAIPGQQIPIIVGNPSLDFTYAMLGGARAGAPMPSVPSEAPAYVTGKWPAGQVADTDAGAVYATTRTQAGTALWNKVFYQSGLFSGSAADIARLIGRGEAVFNNLGGQAEAIVAGWADCELKRDVMAVV